MFYVEIIIALKASVKLSSPLAYFRKKKLDAGDSGAAVVDQFNQIVGTVYLGSIEKNTTSWVNPIFNVLEAVGINEFLSRKNNLLKADFYIAWTGTDKKLNVMTSLDGKTFDDKDKITFAERSEHGPALVEYSSTLYLAWTGTDEKLNIVPVGNGANIDYKNKVRLQEDRRHGQGNGLMQAPGKTASA